MRYGTILLVLCLSACQQQAVQTPEPLPPSLAEFRNATYYGLMTNHGGAVPLRNGRWEAAAASGAEPVTVHTVHDYHIFGDLDGDGQEEAIVLLAEERGGTGPFLYLAVVDRVDGEVRTTGQASLGDRTELRSLKVEHGRLRAGVVQAGENDPACCPGDVVDRNWDWVDGNLREAESALQGRLTPRLLDGTEWELRSFSGGAPDSFEEGEPLPAGSPSITLRFSGGGIMGSAGCNDYDAPVAAGDSSGKISIGKFTVGEQICSGNVAETESRFLESLAGAYRIGFLPGRLRLFYGDEEEEVHSLLFDARP